MANETMEDPKIKKKVEGKPVDVIDYENDVEKKYIPEGFDSVEEFLEDMRFEYQANLDFDHENREQAIDDKKFAAGEQWDPIVLERRKGLPCLVINSVPQFTAQLVGDWRENKNGIKVVPAENGDTEAASVRGDLIRAIQTRSRADRAYDSAFESMVQCGDGAFRVSVRYARNDVFDQELFIDDIDDALSVVWDRFSTDPTGRDARHVFVDDLLPKKEYERKWPGTEISELDTTSLKEMQVGGWINSDGIRVTEYWRLIERKRLVALFQDGSIRALEGGNIEELSAKHGSIVRSRDALITYAQMHLVSGFEILSGPHEYQLDRVPIIRMTGRTVNIAGKRVRHGLVRFMKDPVRLKNFWRSVAAEQLGYAPKFQWMATEEAVEGREDQLRNGHMSRDPLMIFNNEAEFGRNVQRADPPVPQSALLNEAQVNTQDMKDVTGIHDASLGARSNETSGRAIQARQREGDIASLTYYDNGNAAILEAGDVLNQLISQVYDGTRIIRIIGEDEAVKFMKVNDPGDLTSPDLSVGRYDVVATSGTSYSTRRVEAAQAMMDAIQVAPNLMEIAGDIIVKAQDWPGADKLAERLKKTLPPQFLEEGEEGGAPVITPEQMQEMQMQLQAMQQENQMLKTDKTLDFEKIKVDQYNAETQRIRALSDHDVDGNNLELNAIKSILDASVKLSPPQSSPSPADQGANLGGAN